MQELVLTENYIGELPNSIGFMTKLNNLNVDRNRLEYLPPAIGNLVQVTKKDAAFKTVLQFLWQKAVKSFQKARVTRMLQATSDNCIFNF